MRKPRRKWRRVALGVLFVGTRLFAEALIHAADFSVSGRGTSAADFLNLEAGARAAAMGGAYSAVADEASAIYWNPAAITQVPKRSITLMHAAYLASSYFDYGGYVQNGEEYGFFGTGFQYFAAGRLAQTDETGTNLGNFYPYDMAFYWTYARQIQDSEWLPALNGFAFGASAKLVDSKILVASSAGAIDAGLLSPRYFNDHLRLALSAFNLGGDTMQFESAKERLPVILRAGSALRLGPAWIASFDLTAPQTDRPNAAVGTEYWFVDKGAWKLAGRVGFNSKTIGSIDGFTGASFGFGIASYGWAVDYGFAPMGGLGQANRVSVTYNF